MTPPTALAVDADGARRAQWEAPTRWLIDIVVVVVLFYLAIRIRRGPLGPQSLWLDDAWPALVTRVPWSRVPIVGLTSPGYSAILKAWTHVVGFSNTHAQQPALAFGVLGPAAVYLTGRRLALRVLPAAVAATILLVSRNHVIYSTRVKQYTLDALLSTLLIFLAVGVIQHPERAWRWAVLVTTAAVTTAATSLVVPTVSGALLAGAYVAWKRPDARRVATRAIGAYAVFAVAWWAVALRPRINPALRSYWSAFYIRLSLEFPRDVGVGLWRVAHGLLWAPTLATLALLVVAACVVVWTRRELAILFLTPIFVTAVLATLHVAPIGAGRTDINLYPALALTVGVAISEVPMKVWPAMLTACLVLVAVGSTEQTPPAYPRENMRSAAAYLEAKARPTDEVLVYYAGRFPFALYGRAWGLKVQRSEDTAEGFDVQIQRPNLHVLPNDGTMKNAYAPVVARLTEHQSRVWFIGSHGHFDVVTVEKDLKALGYQSHRRPGDDLSAFVTLWVKSS